MWQRFRIIEENRVNIGAVIQLLPAMFAKRDDGKATRFAFIAFANCGFDSGIKNIVSKVGEDAGDSG